MTPEEERRRRLQLMQAQARAQAEQPAPQERGIGASIYDNLIGSDDGVQSYGESIGPWLNRAGESMTFGLVGDEATAAFDSMIGRGEYDERLQYYRDQESKMSGGAQLSADLFGGILPGLAGVGIVSGAASLPGMIGRGAALGAGAGAVHGFMEGEGGIANRTMSGGVGAGIGGILGGAIPLVGAGVQRAWRAGSDAMRAGRVGASIGQDLGVSPNSGRVIADLLTPEDPAAMRAAMDLAGPNNMLADASPITTGLLDATMRSPTPGARLAGERVTARAGQSGDDLIDALVGNQQGPRMPSGINQARQSATARPTINPLYQSAYDTPIDYSSSAGLAIDDIIARIPPDKASKAIKEATDAMIWDGMPNPQIMASIDDAGKVTFTQKPNVMQLDYIKRSFDDIAEGSKDSITQRMSPEGRLANNIARTIRDATKDAVPVYGEALDAASTDIRSRAAVRTGRDLFKPTTEVEDVLASVKDATGAELRHMREGVMNQIDHIMGNVKSVGGDSAIDARQALDAYKMFSSANAKQKLRALFPDDYDAIIKQIDNTGAAIGLRANTAANSATNQRGVFQEAITDAVMPNAIMRGKPLPAAGDAFASLMNANPDAIKRMSRDVQGELADMLTRQGEGPRAVDAIVNALAASPINTEAGKSVRKIIEALMFGNTGSASEGLTQTLIGQRP
jgi:hypothetical protein